MMQRRGNKLTVIFQMKSRTKSTRQNLTIDSKSRRISEEGSRQVKKGKKEEGDTRKYLLKTLGLLQSHLKLDKVDKKANNASLSASVFDYVKVSLAHLPKTNTKQPNALEEYTTQLVITNKENQPNEANRSTASLLNMSSINVKRRSNSTLDEYFKDKFGSPAKDEETIEKKLRVLKALKRSQEIVSKVNQNTTLMNNQNRPNSSLLQDVSERKIMIVEKMKGRKLK